MELDIGYGIAWVLTWALIFAVFILPIILFMMWKESR